MQKFIYTFFLLTYSTLIGAQVTQLTNFTGNQLATSTVSANGDVLFFSADDGTTGEELYRHDLTTGITEQVVEINPNGDNGIGGNIAVFQDGVLFRATDGTNGSELWFSDGTASGTRLVLDINPDGGSFPEEITVVGNEAFFLANDGTTGKELWKTDGTAAGTTLVRDIRPDGDGTPANSGNIYGHNGSLLFFRANDGTSGVELYVSDGTTAGTQLVQDLFAGSGSGMGETTPAHAAIFNGTLFFRGHDGGAATGKELRYYDLTDGQIKLVREINPGPTAQADVKNLFVVDDQLFFRAKEGSDGVEPYVTDGTAAGTIRLGDFNAGGPSSNPVYQTGDPSTGLVYFQAQGSNGNNEPWVSDGTPAGTYQIADMNPGGNGSPGFLGAIDGLAYFTATTGAGSPVGNVGREFFATDGTDVFLVADLNPDGNADLVGFQTILTDGRLLFASNNNNLGRNVYAYNPQQFLQLGELADFGSLNIGTASSPQSFSLAVSGLTAALIVKPSASYQVSLTETGGYTADSLVLTPNASGNVDQDIYVRFVPTLTTTFNGTITVSGPDVVTAQVDVIGVGVIATPDGLAIFDTFDGDTLPTGWAEGPATSGRLTVTDGRLRLDYQPDLPVVTGTRTFDPINGLVYLNFLFNADRNTMNGPVSLVDAAGNTFAQLRFRAGIQLITGLDANGEPTGFVNLINQTLVPRGVDVEAGLVIDLAANTVTATIDGQTPEVGQDVALFQPATELAAVEFTLPFMFGAGGMLIDELMIGNVFLWDLRRNLVRAADLAASADIGTEPGTYPQAAYNVFLDAIFVANGDFVALTDQTAIDASNQAIAEAIDVFLNSINKVAVAIAVDVNDGHDLRKNSFGYNNRSVDQAWSYRNPEFIDAMKAGETGWMRYLSGTISDPFNMNTGLYEPAWVESFDRVNNQVAAEGRLRVKGPQLVSDLYRALGEANAKLIVTWPGFLSGPTEAGLFAKFCADNDIIVEYWQLLNEPFFFMPGRNRYFFQDGNDYAAKSKDISDAIKANYPGAQTAPMAEWGVNFSSDFSLGVRDFEPRWYDLISYHSYAAFNNPSSDEEAILNANAGVKIGGTDAPLKVADVYGPDMKYFITEYNVFNNRLGGTYYAGIYNAEILLRNTQFETMEYTGLHVFNQSVVIPQFNHNNLLADALENGTPLNADTIRYGYEISTQGEAILIAAEAVNDSDFAYATSVTGGTPVPADHPNTLVDEVPSVMAQAYRGENDRDYLVFTNKSEIPHEVTLTGLPLGAETIVTTISSEIPLIKTGVKPVVDTMDLSGGVLIVNGYSITSLSLPVGMRAPATSRLIRGEIDSIGVNLNWWKVDNATSYRVDYGPSRRNPNRSVTIPSGEITSYLLPLSYGFQLYATVTAINGQGESEPSNQIFLKYQRPERPTLVQVQPKDGSVTLLWESVRNANGYTVVYGTSRNRLTEEVDASNTSGFTLEGLQNDQEYFFAVKAYNGSGIGDNSNTISGTPKAQIPFAPIDLRGTANDDGTVDMIWDENDFLFGGSFNVYRSTSPWDGYQAVARDITDLNYTDDLTNQDGTFYYVVRTENDAGESVYPSNIFTVDVINGTVSVRQSFRTTGELSAGSILLQENPVNDAIRLIIPDQILSSSYRVFDLNGRQLLEGNLLGGGNQQIPLSVPAGTYFLNVHSAEGDEQIFKIIKK